LREVPERIGVFFIIDKGFRTPQALIAEERETGGLIGYLTRKRISRRDRSVERDARESTR
jgi:hypothetical protein